ncbi:MAG: hypothetical protein HRT46_12200, partial [Deltaproteobacteria bacterium]|nr:hypothetical protein [Deltaproteobacteria bacterium]
MAIDPTPELADPAVTPHARTRVDGDPVAAVAGQASTPQSQERHSGTRVLLVRPSALGDICRTAPAVATIRAAMPDAHIDFLIEDAFSDALRHHPALDGLILFPRRRFGRAWLRPSLLAEILRWARRLRGERYDLVLDLQGLARSGLVTWMTGARRRVGFARARELAWVGYNHRHRISNRIHHVDRMLGLLEAEGFPPVYDMRLYVGPDDEHWCSQLIPGRFACLAPTSRWRSKCWPHDQFVQVARRLLDSGVAGDHLVLLSAPSERDEVEPMVRQL